jgi:voltage-gated potassium channel
VIPIIAPVVGLLKRFAGALRRGWSESEFRGLLYMVTVTVGTGMVFYHAVESWGWIDSLYFTVITLTTIGYGDLSPTTPGSKLFTVVLVLVGIGLLVSFIERVARYATEDQAVRRNRRGDS